MLDLRSAAGCSTLTDKNRNWGQYINDMEKAGVNARLMASLRDVKDLHRNPLIHPDFTPDMRDAEMFWTQCIGLISLMGSEIEKRKPNNAAAPVLGSATPLALASGSPLPPTPL